MTREEAIKWLKTFKGNTGISELSQAFDVAIQALQQEPCEDAISRKDTRIIHTDGLEEGIRCAMCTNMMANNRGCDGGCVVNESIYKKVLDVIKERMLEQEPCVDAISRQAVLDQTYLWSKDEFLRVTNPFDYLRKRINSLPSVTPQPKIGHWIRDTITDLYHCSECRSIIHQGPKSKDDYCRYCGAKMAESEVEV